jgi:hypothetical protein
MKGNSRENPVWTASVSVDAVKILSASQHHARIYRQKRESSANNGAIDFGEQGTEIIA